MKSKKIEAKEQSAKPFPKLMEGKFTGNVYLMEDAKTGTLLHISEGSDAIGDSWDSFTPSDLCDFYGEIVLSSD